MTNEKLLLRYVKAHYRSIKKSKYTFLIPYIFVLSGFGWIGLYFLNNSDYIRQFFLIPILSSFFAAGIYFERIGWVKYIEEIKQKSI